MATVAKNQPLYSPARSSGKPSTLAGQTESRQVEHVSIRPPNFQYGLFEIFGTAPLVIHRFSVKTQNEMEQKMKAGSTANSKKERKAADFDALFEQSRYRSAQGWDGFHAGALRKAMISACRLVNFKMTLAKLSIFVEADGWDQLEPQVPLVRIYGDPVMQKDIARVETGQPYITVRAAYHGWSAKVKIRWDGDQFTQQDIANLLARVGMQVGLCEGRPDSKNSAGMGWGTFSLNKQAESAAA